MRLLVRATLLSAIFIVVSTYALNQEAQVDILMSKSVRALKENRNADALASMEQLMSMEGSLSKPLPEGFEYLYVETLDKSGNTDKALDRANKYVDKYGTNSKNYGKVIEIIGRLEEVSEKKRKETEQVCVKILDKFCNASRGYDNSRSDASVRKSYSQEIDYANKSWKENRCESLENGPGILWGLSTCTKYNR